QCFLRLRPPASRPHALGCHGAHPGERRRRPRDGRRPAALLARALRRMIRAVVFALLLPLTALAQPKVLHIAQQTIGGEPLDPAQLSSILVANVIENVMEPMLRYDYLARPLKLVPNTLEAMPEVSEGGRVYVCRLKKGIFFTPDPAFRGKPREL